MVVNGGGKHYTPEEEEENKNKQISISGCSIASLAEPKPLKKRNKRAREIFEKLLLVALFVFLFFCCCCFIFFH